MKECNQCGKCCIKYSNGGLSVVEEMMIDEYEMLEEKDLSNPIQAQKALDKIMEDSRTPFKHPLYC